MNGKEVQIGVEPSKDGVLLAVLDQVRSSRRQQVGTKFAIRSAIPDELGTTDP